MKHYLSILSFLIVSNLIQAQSWVELNNQAIDLRDKGDYVKAMAIAEKAVNAIRTQSGENNLDYANSLNTYGSICHGSGELKKAESLYLQARDIRLKLGGKDHRDYANSLSNLGTLYMDMAQYATAESLLIQSNAVHEKIFGRLSIEYANSINNLGVLYQTVSQYQKALPYLRDANGIWKKDAASRANYISSVNNLASVYSDMGQYAKAEALYLEAKEGYLNLYGEHHPLYANCLSNLAKFYAEIKQYQKALPLLIRTCDLTREVLGKDHPDYAVKLYNLAMIYFYLDKFDLALSPCKESLEIWKIKLGTSHPKYAEGLTSLSSLYQLVGQYPKAEQLLREALAIKKNAFGEDHPEFGDCLTQLGFLYFRKRDYQQAEPLFARAMAIMKKAFGESSEKYTTSVNNLSSVYACTSQQAKAAALTATANEAVLLNTLKTFPVLSQKQKEEFLNKVQYNFDFLSSLLYRLRKDNDPANLDNFNQAIMIKSMALTDTRRVYISLQQSKDTNIIKLFIKWSVVKKSLAKQYALPVAQQATDIAKGEAMTDDLERQLNRMSAEFNYQQHAVNIEMGEVQENLQPDEAAIEFINFRVYNRGWSDSIMYAAYILRKDGSVPIFVPLCEEKKLAIYFSASSGTPGIKSLYRSEIIDDNTSNPISGDSLYSLVWKPLEPYLQGIKKIDYSPVGLLSRIAFHALPVADSQLLIDKYKLNRYISIRQLASQPQEQKVKEKSVILFGDPAFTMDSIAIVKNTSVNETATNVYVTDLSATSGRQSWISLPGTAKEIIGIKKLFETNKIPNTSYTQQKTTEEQFKSLSGHSPAILHLATHGFFLPDPAKKRKEGLATDGKNAFTLADDPMLRSGIILSGANRVWGGKLPIEGHEDGIVTAYEISQLDLSKTDLVVLSACETALGDIKGNEGVFGLQRAFKLAGVKNMLLSLWRVPDAETAELMTTFYNYYIQGKTIREAFIAAQMDMRAKYKPYYWAAFVLIE